MAKSLYYLFFAVILLASCNDDNDNPNNFLSGTYEIAWENTDTGIWFVDQYVFKSDGTYEYLHLLREEKNGDDLGYHGYSKGTYSLRGEDFTLKMTEASTLNYDDFPQGYTEALENLEAQEMSVDFVESEGTLKKLDSGKKISILFECNDMLTESLASCIGELVYDRVD